MFIRLATDFLCLNGAKSLKYFTATKSVLLFVWTLNWSSNGKIQKGSWHKLSKLWRRPQMQVGSSRVSDRLGSAQ